MVELTKVQRDILTTDGYMLVTGGPGSGKTTVSILKAAAMTRSVLRPGQRLLFLSFARATVGRVMEAIREEQSVTAAERQAIEVDTYHSFFWRILKTHGYLIGLPRKLSVLTPPAKAIALSAIRSGFGKVKDLNDKELAKLRKAEQDELQRLAWKEGKVCFDFFAGAVGRLLHESAKIRQLISTIYPVIILDEFQDTSAEQWRVVEALGDRSILIALADPEQRIFDFIGADPERLNHFQAAFSPTVHDLSQDNHRSKGTDIAKFGNAILAGKFGPEPYQGIACVLFAANQTQAYHSLLTTTLQARKRLLDSGHPDWSLVILVPTKRMTHVVSDLFNFHDYEGLPRIDHTASVDMEGPLLAAEVIAFLLQQGREPSDFTELTALMCRYLHGRGGDEPAKGDLADAARLQAALEKRVENARKGRPPPGNSVLNPTYKVFGDCHAIPLTGDPDKDWLAVRSALASGDCDRLKRIANDARNVRLLRRGTQLRSLLAQNWRDFGSYRDALEITRQAFVQEHFAAAHKPESGVVVMNMHKAKGKQFDEVIIFEGWPIIVKGQVMANTGRIVRENERKPNLSSERQNFRVSVTRARKQTTIMTPKIDPCVLLLADGE